MTTSTRPAIWATATVTESIVETESARSLVLDVSGWSGHLAGQHVDVRLTAPDGYQATRSYSISSGPGEQPQITVERVDDGEVSPYLVDVARPGDRFEVRGPLGGYFVWVPDGAPLALFGGGSGIAPLRAMWRADGSPIRLVYSARTASRVLFADELANSQHLETRIHLTREELPEYFYGRIDGEAVVNALEGLSEPSVFVCGPTAFVEAVATTTTAVLGDAYPVRTERFG